MAVDYWLIPSAASRTGHTQAAISFKAFYNRRQAERDNLCLVGLYE